MPAWKCNPANHLRKPKITSSYSIHLTFHFSLLPTSAQLHLKPLSLWLRFLFKRPTRNQIVISLWAKCLIFKTRSNLVAQGEKKSQHVNNRMAKTDVWKRVQPQMCAHVHGCARTRPSVWAHLVSVWYSLCASSFDSQNTAWNMAVSLAIMSRGKTIQLNSLDPAGIKWVGKVLFQGRTPDPNWFFMCAACQSGI